MDLVARDAGERAGWGADLGGEVGSVLMSLPTSAEVSVNCVPASCIPSPESPANRMVTDGTVWTGLFVG